MMDEATRLCLEADLMMALAPLVGQHADAVTAMDASVRVHAVLRKYQDQLFTVEPEGRDTLHIRADPALSEVVATYLRTFREGLSD